MPKESITTLLEPAAVLRRTMSISLAYNNQYPFTVVYVCESRTRRLSMRKWKEVMRCDLQAVI